MGLHLAIWGLVSSGWSRPALDLTGLTLDLVVKARAASPSRIEPKDDVWRRPERPWIKTKVSTPPPALPQTVVPITEVPAPVVSPGPVRSYSLAELGQAPKPLQDLKPVYPPEAKSHGIEGTVILQVDIDATGAVKKVTLVKGLGYGCDEAAMDALWKTPFSPPISAEGHAVPAQVLFTYRFRLNEIDAP